MLKIAVAILSGFLFTLRIDELIGISKAYPKGQDVKT